MTIMTPFRILDGQLSGRKRGLDEMSEEDEDTIASRRMVSF
jgi:hypothetical protein